MEKKNNLQFYHKAELCIDLYIKCIGSSMNIGSKSYFTNNENNRYEKTYYPQYGFNTLEQNTTKTRCY